MLLGNAASNLGITVISCMIGHAKLSHEQRTRVSSKRDIHSVSAPQNQRRKFVDDAARGPECVCSIDRYSTGEFEVWRMGKGRQNVFLKKSSTVA